ncbi:MAG: hypothetical protein COV91_04945 [Candidatus Taylorbacteria bacterium CG11_big_fil_rev_8_21_14_0_20_46_11]|uniref:HD domain-containing protein n=1 Tax=Candidatus Taylorbacteria bacterium CG11_big_fil_rev_8_21_14_0_20_46_11 TaxID=1975025 RepID=A0A2H0KAK6_9BACT|nr:MAG: hypothetical protein COV91_04945 [Candidatus Taylorbacteria bacterium CG11_big_fil_rev_8_21_14_0_20_46_11]
MRTVQEIYTQYRIMPFLQLHQLRVAGVASFIAQNLKLPVHDIQQVLFACLFHDMGNIIKSDLDVFPESVQPEGRKFWQSVKDEFVAKYGNDEHEATIAIAKELSLPPIVCDLIDGFGFSKVTSIAGHGSILAKVCEYADMRVAPQGIVSVEQRLEEGKIRYENKKQTGGGFSVEKYDELVHSLTKIEQELFAGGSVQPEQITDQIIGMIVDPLRKLTL